MASLLEVVVTSILPERCYDEFFAKSNYFHGECLKIALSKGLGFGIILGSVLVKVPQILKILHAKSGAGISFSAVVLELFAITVAVAYSFAKQFPFSSWGEGLFLLIQTVTIGCLVLYFESTPTRLVTFALLYACSLVFLLGGFAPIMFLATMQIANLPIVVSSKLIQARENYNNKSTGQLSAATVFLIFGGSVARIFTSIQETGDNLIIMTYVCAASANALIAAQMVYYWESSKKLLKKD